MAVDNIAEITLLCDHGLQNQGARWSAPKLRTTGPDRSNGPLVQTGLMIFLMVLDRSDCADGLVWTIGPNGPPMEFSMWNI